MEIDATGLGVCSGSKLIDSIPTFKARDDGGLSEAEVAAFDVDTKVIDGAVNGVGRGVKGASERLRPLQNGLVRSYAAGILLGAVGLLVWLLARGAF